MPLSLESCHVSILSLVTSPLLTIALSWTSFICRRTRARFPCRTGACHMRGALHEVSQLTCR